jgi:transcriptional regulator with XRE-family HTH domain
MPGQKELEREIKVLKQRVAELEKVVKDPSKRGYYALCKVIYQQIEFLECFNLKTQIEGNPKEDKIYDRAKGLWEGMKTMIMDCRALKQELKISAEEEEQEMKKIRYTPESISNVLGNTAGQEY